MRALIQRVTAAGVTVDGVVLGRIAQGYVVFLGVGVHDQHGQAEWLAKKIMALRLFPDASGNRSF
jgi:D-tyrosyl-tRNA(Tyr) deacylase